MFSGGTPTALAKAIFATAIVRFNGSPISPDVSGILFGPGNSPGRAGTVSGAG
jgi:hypothetical protein